MCYLSSLEEITEKELIFNTQLNYLVIFLKGKIQIDTYVNILNIENTRK